MSRTDKDLPFWVRANDPQERRIARHNHRRMDERGCTIDEPVLPRWEYPRRIVESSYFPPRKVGDYPPCEYNFHGEINYSYGKQPSALDRREQYHGPQRMYARMEIQEALKSYRAGEMNEDYDIPSYQARHAPDTRGGWWN